MRIYISVPKVFQHCVHYGEETSPNKTANVAEVNVAQDGIEAPSRAASKDVEVDVGK